MRARDFIIEQENDQQTKFIRALVACDQGTWTVSEAGKGTEVQYSQLYDKSTSTKNPKVVDRLESFLALKSQDPTAPFGSSDTPFIAAGPLGQAIPKLRHAHLSHDVSVFYKVEGINPTVIKIYGLFSHKESGTGHAPNIKIQKQLAARIKNSET